MAKPGKPEDVNCSPELGAAAMVIVKLGSQSSRIDVVVIFAGLRLVGIGMVEGERLCDSRVAIPETLTTLTCWKISPARTEVLVRESVLLVEDGDAVD